MGKATRKFENSPIISTLISRFRLHAMHVDVSTINHKFDKRVPSFSFYFLASSQRKFQQRDRERERGGEGEVIRYATVASDTLSDKEGFSRREQVSRSRQRWRKGGEERRVARKKQRKEESSNSMERYLHCAQWKILGGDLSAGRFSLPRRALATLARRTPCDPRVCIRKGRSF